MIEGKTKSGIEFSINEEVFADPRLKRRIEELQKLKIDSIKDNGEEIDQETRQNMIKLFDTFMKFSELIFGTADNFDTFLDEIAARNNGKCTYDLFIKEFLEIIENIKVKN